MINPDMQNRFAVYKGKDSKNNPVRCYAHQIIMVESGDKRTTITYKDETSDVVKSMVLALKGHSLKSIMDDHPGGFWNVSRSAIVNPAYVSGVFHTSESSYGCSVRLCPGILPVGRTRQKELKRLWSERSK